MTTLGGVRPELAARSRGGGVHAGARWSTIGKGGVQGIRFLTSLLVFNLLGPEQTGLMNMALIVTGFLDQFKDFGTAQAVIQRRVLTEEFVSTVFVFNILLGLIASTLLVLAAAPISWIFQEPDVVPILRAVGPIFLVTCLGLVHRAMLSRELRFESIARSDIAGAVTHGIVAILLASLGFGVWALVGGLLASSVVSVVCLWWFSPCRPRLRFDSEYVVEVRSFCANLMGFNLLNYLLNNLDRILVGRLLGTTALGFYGFAFYLTMFPVRSITSIVIGVLIPALARVQDDDARLQSNYLRACAGVALVTFPMMGGIFVVADPLVRTLWPSWVPAIALIMLLTPAGIVHAIGNTNGAIYLAKGRSDWMLRTSIAFGLLQTFAFWIGTRWGIRGVAAAYAASSMVLAYFYFAIPFRLIGLRVSDLVRELSRCALATAIMVAGTILGRTAFERLGLDHRIVLAACVFLGIGLYVAAIWWLRPSALRDLRSVLVSKGS